MKPRMNKRFARLLAFSLLLGALPMMATPVLFSVQQFQRSPSNAGLVIKPENNPLAGLTNIFAGENIETNLSGGRIVVELVPNDYQVVIEGVPKAFVISVFDTNVVMNAVDLQKRGLATYLYTNRFPGVMQVTSGDGSVTITPGSGQGPVDLSSHNGNIVTPPSTGSNYLMTVGNGVSNVFWVNTNGAIQANNWASTAAGAIQWGGGSFVLGATGDIIANSLSGNAATATLASQAVSAQSLSNGATIGSIVVDLRSSKTMRMLGPNGGDGYIWGWGLNTSNDRLVCSNTVFSGQLEFNHGIQYRNGGSASTSWDLDGLTGTITASLFNGSGASLTSLNASQLTSGTVPTARLDTLANQYPGAVTNSDTRSLLFTNVTTLGGTNTDTPSNFGVSPQFSISNIFVGISLSAMRDSHSAVQGPWIGVPDGGGMMGGNGDYVQFRNNAHGNGAGGNAIAISSGIIGLLSPLQLGFSGHMEGGITHQYNDNFGTIGPVPFSNWDLWATHTGAFSVQSYGGTDAWLGRFGFWSGALANDGSGPLSGDPSKGRLVAGMGTNYVRYEDSLIGKVRTGLAAATNVVLDFRGAQSTYDLTVTTLGIVLATTNHGAALEFPFTNGVPDETKEWLLRARGGLFSITYPAWATNTALALPASVTAGQMLYLKLKSLGQGEANVMVLHADVYSDPTFIWDLDATNFFARASITSATSKSVVNQLVTDAKNHGWWNYFTNGVGYTLLGGETNNLFNNAVGGYVPQGTFTTNSSGFTGDGITGCADTRFRPSAQGFSPTNICYYVYADTNNAVSGSTPIGNEATVYGRINYLQGGGSQVWDARGPNSSANTITPDLTLFPGAADKNVLSERTNSATISLFSGSVISSASQANSGIETSSAFFAAANEGNPAPATFYKGTIKFVLIGQGITSAALVQQMFADITRYQAALGRQ